MPLVLLGSKCGAGEDVGLHQHLTPTSAGRGPQIWAVTEAAFGAWCCPEGIELGAQGEHPGEVKTLEWLLLWQENKPVSAQSQLGKGWEPAWMGMPCWKAKRNSFWTNLLTKGIKQGQNEVLRECFHPEQRIFCGSDLV